MKKEIIKTLVVAGVVFQLSACGPSLTSSEHLEKGKQFFSENQQYSAIIELKNSIKKQSDNAEARFILASVYISQGDYKSAEKELERALALGYTAEQVIPKLVEVKFKLHDYAEVIEFVDAGHELTDDSYVIVLTYAGMSSLYSKQFELAQNYLSSAVQISSDSLYGQLSQGYLARSEAELDEAIASIEKLVNNYPDFVDAHLLKGYLLQANKQYLSAAEAFKGYNKLRPKEVSIMFFIAQNYLRAGKYDIAEPIVDSILALSKENALANLMKAQILFEQQNFISAQEYAENAFQRNEQLLNARVIAGVSAYKTNKYEQAYNYLLKVKDYAPEGHFVKALLIELQIRLGYSVEAESDLNAMLDAENVDSSVMLATGNELMSLGQVSAAQELLNKSEFLKDTDTSSMTQRGILKLRLEDVVSGIEILEKSLQLDPSSEAAESALAIGYIKNKQFDLAMKIAKKWQQLDDRKIQGLLLQSIINIQLGKTDQAISSLNSIIAIDEKNTIALFQLGSIAQHQKKIQEAFNFYSKVLEINPGHQRASANFIHLIADSADYLNKGLDFYNKINVENPNNYTKMGLAHVYKLKNNFQEALTLYKEIASSPSAINGVEIMIGDMYSLLNKTEKATKEYQKYFNKNKKSIIAGNRLTAVYEKSENYQAAIQHLNTMINYHSEKKGLVLLKAYFQSLVGAPIEDSSLNIIQDYPQLREFWMHDQLKGNIAYAKQDFSKAAKLYQQAYSKNPSNITLRANVRTLTLSGDIDGVINFLTEHMRTYSTSTDVEMMLANAYIHKNQPQKAIDIYFQAIQQDQANLLALNNVAYLLMGQGDSDDALMYIKMALDVDANSSALLDTYGQVLSAKGDFNEAIKAFDMAINNSTGNSFPFIINKAETLIHLDKRTEAKLILTDINTSNEVEKKHVAQLLSSIK